MAKDFTTIAIKRDLKNKLDLKKIELQQRLGQNIDYSILVEYLLNEIEKGERLKNEEIENQIKDFLKEKYKEIENEINKKVWEIYNIVIAWNVLKYTDIKNEIKKGIEDFEILNKYDIDKNVLNYVMILKNRETFRNVDLFGKVSDELQMLRDSIKRKLGIKEEKGEIIMDNNRLVLKLEENENDKKENNNINENNSNNNNSNDNNKEIIELDDGRKIVIEKD